ncbi:NUDIX hydrolase [Longibacter salinarum]|uniref:NUDIX hydrolase n=1 Tax=Longibacter salinarum TaxID=1850348 RepID=A0A2A8CWR2_9BACT|nr:NUDIX hydrolase [Longibacter salinarum]PEN13034.1 NUDIX hydrolase [Longibacter salinarum]
MLLFAPSDAYRDDLDEVRRHGLIAPEGEELTLFLDLGDVPRGAERIYVVDTSTMQRPPKRATGRTVEVEGVPSTAIRNVDPYRPPEVVKAGGGYVLRIVDGEPVLLLIHRRGVWDLPKGKLDPGESIAECALREVREEVGIEQLAEHQPLGTTHHAYPDGGVYAVKITHWYLMQTPERHFKPERKEGIRRVAWARWPVAREHIGYDSLARHMDRVEGTIRRFAENSS